MKDFLRLTGGPLPTPGGGSSAALAGALAAALVEKIARKTQPKQRRAAALLKQSIRIRQRLTRAIHDDAHWYWRVVLAFRKQDRRAALRALVRATSVPKSIVADARDIVRLIRRLEPLCSRVWKSDLRCAWLLAEAAQGAGLALIIANQQFMSQWQQRRP